jgi:SRSO17 transposase
MTEQREAVPTVGFIDEYCQDYRSLFADIRSFEAFRFVHVGMLSAIARKSLPAIAKLVGLDNSQNLQHLFQNTQWHLDSFRGTRLLRIRQATDDVTKQYIGNLGFTKPNLSSPLRFAKRFTGLDLR